MVILHCKELAYLLATKMHSSFRNKVPSRDKLFVYALAVLQNYFTDEAQYCILKKGSWLVGLAKKIILNLLYAKPIA